MPKHIPRVALLIESSRIYGRGILRGIVRYERTHGPWSFFTQERELHSGIPAWLKTWKGDGIIARIENRRMAAQLLKLGCPVVDVLGEGRFAGIPGYTTDAQAVAKLAADFFLQAGFNHFAFCGFPGIPFSDLRGAAFTAYLTAKGKKVGQTPATKGTFTAGDIQAVEQQGIDSGRTLARWLRAQPRPLAVFACNDVRAQQLLNACRAHDIRVPEEVAVIGVDNDDVLCGMCDPPLTSIAPATERMGYEAAALLGRMMAGEASRPVFTQLPPVGMEERTSTDATAIDDPVTVQAVRFIRNELGRGIAVKDVLAHVHRSRTDLEQRFQQWLGVSIHAEIQRRRLDRVCQLLREPGLNLNEVARLAGFATAAHLCRVFRVNYRMTPMQFRLGEQGHSLFK